MYLRDQYNSVIMYPPCLIVVENLLLDLRMRVAHALRDSGLTQTEIAHTLHVSQAMVSKYLSSDVEPSSERDEVSQEIARMIIQGKDEKDVLLYLCQTCFRWREGGSTCSLHNLPGCAVCSQLRSPEILDEKRSIIQNVKEALSLLESCPGVVNLMPQVRMNIAMSLENAQNPMEVAAFPGRLAPVHGTVTAVSDPEFGASHHLASLLLKTKKRAVINIKYTDRLTVILRELGISFSYSMDECRDVLIDKGGFGIEPSAYIFGKDAVNAALTLLKISQILEQSQSAG
jgi:predicted fused transcriptional regulator/phosphomethylpyrimidine kinase/predicted transcriptional regulator